MIFLWKYMYLNDLIVKDMKTLFIKGLAFAAAVAAMASCTKDATEEEPAPVFPQLQSVTIQAGDQQSLSFTADKDWKLSIDKTTWCTFLDGEVETAQLSGLKGEVTVTVLVKDNGLDFNSDVAKLDLTLGNKTETIFEITRPGKAREVKLYAAVGDGELTEVEKLEFKWNVPEWGDPYMDQMKFAVVANYDWTVATPEKCTFSDKSWNEIPGVTGKAGVGPEDEGFSLTYIKVNEDANAYEINGKLVVTDTEGKNPVEFDIVYPGYPENKVAIEPASLLGMFGMNFNIDGFVINKNFDQEVVTTDKEVNVSVKARNMEYSVYQIANNEGKAVELGKDAWLKINDDKKGGLKVSATQNTGGDREVYILVLPKALVKDFKIEDFIDQYGYANYDYDGMFIKVSQKGVTVTKDFKALWGRTYADIKAVEFSKYPDFKDMTPSGLEYGSCDDNAYVIEITENDVIANGQSSGALQFAPLGFPDGYYAFGGTADSHLYRMTPQSGDWDEKYIHDATLYTSRGSIHGLQIDPEQFVNTTDNTSKKFEGMVVFQFYKTAEDKQMYKSSATLVIVKK